MTDCRVCGGEGWLPSRPEGKSECPYCKQVSYFEALKAEHEAEGTEFECDICENPAEQPVQELEPDGTKIWWHVCESCAEQIERSNDRIQREITEEARGDYERDQAKDRMSYE